MANREYFVDDWFSEYYYDKKRNKCYISEHDDALLTPLGNPTLVDVTARAPNDPELFEFICTDKIDEIQGASCYTALGANYQYRLVIWFDKTVDEAKEAIYKLKISALGAEIEAILPRFKTNNFEEVKEAITELEVYRCMIE